MAFFYHVLGSSWIDILGIVVWFFLCKAHHTITFLLWYTIVTNYFKSHKSVWIFLNNFFSIIYMNKLMFFKHHHFYREFICYIIFYTTQCLHNIHLCLELFVFVLWTLFMPMALLTTWMVVCLWLSFSNPHFTF